MEMRLQELDVEATPSKLSIQLSRRKPRSMGDFENVLIYINNTLTVKCFIIY